jgi:WD40 repeat protein
MNSIITFEEFSSIYPKNELYRCPKCFHIQLSELVKIKNEIIVKLICLNNHFEKKTLENALKDIKENQINNIFCSNCDIGNMEDTFFYCIKHNNFICKSCSYIHHSNCNLISLSNFDINCFIHNKNNFFFCKKCEKEICVDCIKEEHKNHFFYEIQPLDNNYIEEYQNNIEKVEKYLKIFSQEFKNLMLQIENDINIINSMAISLVKNFQLEINYSKNLINVYKKCQLNKQLSYPVIENVRNFKFKFPSYDLNNIKIKEIIDKLNLLFSESKEIINQKNDIENLFSSSFSNNSLIKSIKSSYSSHLSNKSENSIKEITNYTINGNENITKKITKQKNYSFKLKKNIFTSKNNGYLITALTITNEGQLITGNENGKIDIYSLDNKITLENSFSPHKKSINYLTKLKDGKIISCSNDSKYNISLFSIKNNYSEVQSYINGHKDKVNQVIEISNYNIISISSDKTIRIFEKNDNKYKKINKKIFSSSINGIIELNNIELACSDFYNEKILILDNNNNLDIKFEIKNIKCGSLPTSIILINKEFFAVGGEGLYIISIDNKKICKYINSNFIYMKCLFFDNDNNEIICGDENGNFSIYNIETHEFENIKSLSLCHSQVIYAIIKSNDGIIISSSFEIKLWGDNE